MTLMSSHGLMFQVDSIAWNPHKMVGAPLQTSAFIVRHKGILHTTNSANATYLFQQVDRKSYTFLEMNMHKEQLTIKERF